MDEPMSYDDAIQEIKRLQQSLQAAMDEIGRLRGVVSDHTKRAAAHVVNNAEVETITVLDICSMRTHVKVQPRLHDFYLAEPLDGWSSEHRHAFHQNVVTGFAEREAEAIGRSIWATR